LRGKAANGRTPGKGGRVTRKADTVECIRITSERLPLGGVEKNEGTAYLEIGRNAGSRKSTAEHGGEEKIGIKKKKKTEIWAPPMQVMKDDRERTK